MNPLALLDVLRWPRKPRGALYAPDPPVDTRETPPTPPAPSEPVPTRTVRCWCCGWPGGFCLDTCRGPRRVSLLADTEAAVEARYRQYTTRRLEQRNVA